MDNELQNVFLNCFNHCILTMLTTLVHYCGLFVTKIQTNKQTTELEEDKRHSNLLFHNLSRSLPLLLLMKKASRSYCMDFE